MFKAATLTLIPLAATLAFPLAASAETATIDQKLYHGSATSADVTMTIASGSLVTVETWDSYPERVTTVQANERVYVYGVTADGGSVLLGSTVDLADNVETASSSSSWTAGEEFVGLHFALNEDTSSPNSVFVKVATVTPPPEPPPAPTTTEAPATTVPTAEASVPATTPPVATTVAPVPTTVAVPTLPVTGASTVAIVGMVAAGAALILGGSMLVRFGASKMK